MHIFILLFLLFHLLFLLFAYKRYIRFRTSVNVIPGPPVSSLLLGNLNLFRWVKPSSFSLKPATKAFYIRGKLNFLTLPYKFLFYYYFFYLSSSLTGQSKLTLYSKDKINKNYICQLKVQLFTVTCTVTSVVGFFFIFSKISILLMNFFTRILQHLSPFVQPVPRRGRLPSVDGPQTGSLRPYRRRVG